MHGESNGFSGDTVKFSKTDPNLFRSINMVKPNNLSSDSAIPETPKDKAVMLPEPITRGTKKEIIQKPSLQPVTSKREAAEAAALRVRCKQLGISVFLQEGTATRSLGFTSAIAGEGKTFMASLTAQALAEDIKVPVTLLECNWENPSFNNSFHLAPGPGLAEWLFGESTLDAIRRPVSSNLTVIPAGEGKDDSIKLLQTFRQRGVLNVLKRPAEVLIVDLPSTVTTEYGQLAARLVESLILVVRMGVTPDAFVTEACHYVKDVHVHGVVFNQITSRIPRWLRQAL